MAGTAPAAVDRHIESLGIVLVGLVELVVCICCLIYFEKVESYVVGEAIDLEQSMIDV